MPDRTPALPHDLRPLPGYAQRGDGPAPAGGLQRWWVGLRHATWPRRSAAGGASPSPGSGATGPGAGRLHDQLCADLLGGRLACAPDAQARWTALAASIGHFAAAGLPVHVVAADAEAADAAQAQLRAHGLIAARLDPKAPPRVRRRHYATTVSVAEVLPWARDLLHDTALVGERPRAVQMLLERGVASVDTDSRLDRALLPGRPVLVVLDPQVTLLDGAQVPVALQAGRALPGLAPDAVVQRSVQALLQPYRHVCGLTDVLARLEADELALDCRLPMGRSVPRWAPPGWPAAAPWQGGIDDDSAWSQQVAWARTVLDGSNGTRSQAWLLCTHSDSARSLQLRLEDAGEAARGVRAMTWATAREAANQASPDARVHALAAEWPATPVLALQCLRSWCAVPHRPGAPRFDGGIVPASDRILAAWRQVARARSGSGPSEGSTADNPSGSPIDADALLAWQLRERAQARRQMMQNEGGMRQLLAFAGGSIG